MDDYVLVAAELKTGTLSGAPRNGVLRDGTKSVPDQQTVRTGDAWLLRRDRPDGQQHSAASRPVAARTSPCGWASLHDDNGAGNKRFTYHAFRGFDLLSDFVDTVGPATGGAKFNARADERRSARACSHRISLLVAGGALSQSRSTRPSGR